MVILLVGGIFAATKILIQREQVLRAVRVYSYSVVLLCALGVYIYGGVIGPIPIGFFVPIAAAGLLGRSSDSLRVGIAAAVCYLVLTIAQKFFGLRPLIPLQMSGIFAFIFILFASGGILSFISWLTSRDLTHVMIDFGKQTEELLERTRELTDKSNQQIELGSELSAAASELQVTSRAASQRRD